MMRTKNVDMLSGPITKGLLTMIIPIMIMNVMQSLFNIIDMTVLRIFSTDRAVGAVGACGVLITICTSLLIGISVGANVVIARRLGAKDQKRADKAVMTSLLFSIAGGIVLMVIGITLAETFLKMTNCPEGLLPKATAYFQIYFCGVPILMFYNFCAAILRATGDTKRPMVFLIISGVIKALFNVLFAAVFAWDVEGVAVATIISSTVASTLAFYVLLKRQDVVHINFREIKFDLAELKAIVVVGIPAGLQTALYSVANAVITTAVNGFGEAATTGISIANQFDGILYQICYSPSLAVTPYVAQNIGAGNFKRVGKVYAQGVLITVLFGAFFGSLSAIFSGQLSSIMSSDPAVIAYSQQKMVIISSTYFICGIYEIAGGVLRGMGKSIIPTITTLLFMCALRFVWVYAIFPLYPNLTFLYAVWPVGWILSIATLLPAYCIVLRKLKAKHATTG